MEPFLNGLIGGGVGAAIIGGIFMVIHTLINKKVTSPADKLAAAKADKDEKTELLAEIKEERSGLKQDLQQLKDGLEAAQAQIRNQGGEINTLREEALARDHYIYRCIGEIQRNGGRIPLPHPEGMEF